MDNHIRVVATGHDALGRAIVASDATVGMRSPTLMPGLGFHFLWHRAQAPVFPDAGTADAGGPYFPQPGGLRWVVFTVPAERHAPPPGTDLAAAKAEADVMLPGLLALMEPDHPGMHRSATIDFAYVLDGEVVLDLGDGRETLVRAGETVVQNATRHAWRNRSGRPCKLLVVMAGAATVQGEMG
ncbi:MAG: cupin domain-containing protein [Rubrivivax sp.]